MKKECFSCGYEYEGDLEKCPVCGYTLSPSTSDSQNKTKTSDNSNSKKTQSILAIVFGAVSLSYQIFRLFIFLFNFPEQTVAFLSFALCTSTAIVSLILGIGGMKDRKNKVRVFGLVVGIVAISLSVSSLSDLLNGLIGLHFPTV